MRIAGYILLVSLILSSGCDLYQQDDYKEYYVVESYLVAGDLLPLVRLSTTSTIEQEYTFEDNAVSDAQVVINRLNADSSIAQTYPYQQQDPGRYVPATNAIVQDEQLYQLSITTSDGEEISATTFVPGNFTTVNELQNEYTYQSEQQIEVDATPSSYITGRQTYYIFTVNVVSPDTSKLTPFYRDLVLDQDNDIENYYINSSGIINQGNYEQNEDGTITLRVPWLAIAFFDTNYVVANAIDDNMYDFLRSQDVQTGGSTLSPGEIQNIRYNVEGGIGIFGSMSSDTNQVVITRPGNQ